MVSFRRIWYGLIKMSDKFNLKLAFNQIKDDFLPQNRRRTIWRYFLILLGSLILACGTSFFLIPYNIVSGGVSGLGIIFQQAFSLNAEGTNTVITILQLFFFVLGYFLLGAPFTLKTLVSSIMYPAFLFLCNFILENTNGFLYLGPEEDIAIQVIAGVAGGALVGLGVGLTFCGGGSTGGVDCLGIYLAKKLKVRTGIMTFTVDFIIILSDLFVSDEKILSMLIGVFAAVITSVVLDRTYISNRSYMALIISTKWRELNEKINNDLERGTTLLKGLGGYTSSDKVVILVAFEQDEYDELQKQVVRIDPQAFMSIVNASEINGTGFRKFPKKIKQELKDEKKHQKEDK